MIDTRRQVLERPGVAMAERQSTNSAMLAQAETAVIEVASCGRVQDVIDARVQGGRVVDAPTL